MARFGQRTSEHFSDVETANLLSLSPEFPHHDRDTIKSPIVTLSSRSSSDASLDLDGFAEYARPRRRRLWWTRLFMSLRQRGQRRSRTLDDRTLSGGSGSLRRKPVSVRAGGVCLSLLAITLSMFGLIHIWNFVIGLGPVFWDEGIDDWWPSYGAPGQIGEGIDHYPTDFTRDVTPIPCHSHNDYWRKRPLYDALHYGCTGVEADVWIFPDDPELYVGHSASALTKNRTFTAMYIDPIADILDRMNNQTGSFVASDRSTPRGVFDEDPDQTLVLLVDFKNGDRNIFDKVYAQTQRLRDADYLTHWDGASVVSRPVTIVGTGNTPFDMVVANASYRSIFFDAPLSQLAADPDAMQHGQGSVGVSADSKFDASNSYYASINFRAAFGSRFWHRFSARQLQTLRSQVAGAKRAGLKARYWGAPSWPIAERNAIWKLLWEEDVGVLNADDLLSVSKMDWRSREERAQTA